MLVELFSELFETSIHPMFLHMVPSYFCVINPTFNLQIKHAHDLINPTETIAVTTKSTANSLFQSYTKIGDTLSEPATIKHSEKTYKKKLFQLASDALIVKKNYYSKALEYLSIYLQIYTKGDYLWVWHVIWFIKLHFKL